MEIHKIFVEVAPSVVNLSVYNIFSMSTYAFTQDYKIMLIHNLHVRISKIVVYKVKWRSLGLSGAP